MPKRARLYITIKRPGGARRTFAFIRDEGPGRPKLTMHEPRLDAINAEFLAGRLDYASAHHEVEQLKRTLLAEYKFVPDAPPIHSFNVKLVEKYYADVVSVRPLKDPDEPYNRLMRAVRLLGNLSLRSASQKDIQKRINTLVGTPQRKAITSLNSLLKFIGRTDVKLYAGDLEDTELEYMTAEEFAQLRREIPRRPFLDELLVLAYGTGARIGEVLGLAPDDRVEDLIWIRRQKVRPRMAQGGKQYRPPKGKRARRVVPLNDETLAAFDRWMEATPEQREALRYIPSELIKTTAQRLWPKVRRTHGGIHMLRKSHCLALLRAGFGVPIAAKQLGDSEAVVQRHYASFVHTDDSIRILQEGLRKLLK